MSKYDPKECARLLALRAKATPGPWIRLTPNIGVYSVGPDGVRYEIYEGGSIADNDFIAAAHSMADQIEALQEIVRVQRETLKDCLPCLPAKSGIERDVLARTENADES